MSNPSPEFLDSLFSPLTFHDFLSTTFTKEFLVARGDAERFNRFCSLEHLLNTLQSSEFSSEQVTLVRDGNTIDPTSFVQEGQPQRVDFPKVKSLLAEKAALLLLRAHTVIEPLANLSHDLTRAFSENVNINVYFGGPYSKGFPLHVDHHDVLVLQVLGRKRWTIYSPTFSDPILLPEHLRDPPSGEPLWQGDLSAGDVLYLPRGFWHCAQGVSNSGTLHLACGIQPLTGLHFLTWLRGELMENSIFRKSIALYDAKEEQEAYFLRLKQALNDVLTPTMLESFVQEHRHRIWQKSQADDDSSIEFKGEKDNEDVRDE